MFYGSLKRQFSRLEIHVEISYGEEKTHIRTIKILRIYLQHRKYFTLSFSTIAVESHSYFDCKLRSSLNTQISIVKRSLRTSSGGPEFVLRDLS
jgi:hypothetical protein